MSTSIHTLLKLLAVVKNPLPPILDRLGLPMPSYRMRLKNGVLFDMRPHQGDWYAFHEVWLANMYMSPSVQLLPGGKVIDVGANIGCFTIYAAQAVGPAGKVIAVEPAHTTFQQLERNVALNCLTNVIPLQVAVSKEAGTTTLYLSENSVFSSFYSKIAAKSKSEQVQETTTVTLEQLLEENRWDRCHFLKIDCEGAEHGIIRSLSARTAAKIDQIAMEIHNVEGFDSKDLIDRLKSFGFSATDGNIGNVFFFWRPAN